MNIHSLELINAASITYSLFYTTSCCVANRDYVNSTLQDASNKEVAGIAIVVLVLVVSPIIIILVRNAVATIQVSDCSFHIIAIELDLKFNSFVWRFFFNEFEKCSIF